VRRLGGPTLTTLCATFMGWRLAAAPSPDALPGAFTAVFGLLCALHGILILAALRHPWVIDNARQRGPEPKHGAGGKSISAAGH
jgi:hypothetical protein